MKFVFFVLIFAFSSIGWTQEPQQTSLSISFQYGKVDAFTSLQFNGYVYKRITFESALGVGFRTTILQGRLFPQFSAGIGFNVLSNVSEKLSLSPMISGRISGYQLSPETRLNYTELMPGYSFTWGNRIRLVQSTFFGKGWESNQGSATFPFWTFSVNLGIGYVF
jgi:hypothetical protein